MKELKQKTRDFCDLVLAGSTITAAARAVGCKGPSAEVQATRWMKQAAVREYMAAKRAEITSPRILTARDRQEWLSAIILGDELDTTCFFGEEKRVRASLTIRLKAAELLAKMRGELGEQPASTSVVYVVSAPQQAQTSLEWAKEVEAEVVAEVKGR